MEAATAVVRENVGHATDRPACGPHPTFAAAADVSGIVIVGVLGQQLRLEAKNLAEGDLLEALLHERHVLPGGGRVPLSLVPAHAHRREHQSGPSPGRPGGASRTKKRRGLYLTHVRERLADLVEDKLLDASLHKLELLFVADGAGADRTLLFQAREGDHDLPRRCVPVEGRECNRAGSARCAGQESSCGPFGRREWTTHAGVPWRDACRSTRKVCRARELCTQGAPGSGRTGSPPSQDNGTRQAGAPSGTERCCCCCCGPSLSSIASRNRMCSVASVASVRRKVSRSLALSWRGVFEIPRWRRDPPGR